MEVEGVGKLEKRRGEKVGNERNVRSLKRERIWN
jgi:hypothetical protein